MQMLNNLKNKVKEYRKRCRSQCFNRSRSWSWMKHAGHIRIERETIFRQLSIQWNAFINIHTVSVLNPCAMRTPAVVDAFAFSVVAILFWPIWKLVQKSWCETLNDKLFCVCDFCLLFHLLHSCSSMTLFYSRCPLTGGYVHCSVEIPFENAFWLVFQFRI